VPLWPASPSAGWAWGVDTATGLPTGSPLVELETAVETSARPNQGALDVHGPYGADCQVSPSAQFLPQAQLLLGNPG